LTILRLLQENINLTRKLSDYLSLVKYKLSLAVAFSAATGYLICTSILGPDFIVLIAGIFFLTAGSAALNQYTEREQDALMPRTMERPVAAKKIPLKSAFVALILLLLSGSFLLFLNGLIPLVLGFLGVILYNLLYTSLKKVTVLAIIPGALVGSIPPLIGYTSAGGIVFSNKILFFSAFMFLWQIPHFWLLLIRYGKEYQEAGFRTVYDYLNEKQIKNLILFWILLSVLCLFIFSLVTSLLRKEFAIPGFILTLIFIILFCRFLIVVKGSQNLKYAFILLNSYGFGMMLILIADSIFS